MCKKIVERGGFADKDALWGEAKGFRSHDPRSHLQFKLGSLRGGFLLCFMCSDYRVSCVFSHVHADFPAAFGIQLVQV